MNLLTLMKSSDLIAVTINIPPCVVLILHHWLMSLVKFTALSDSTAVTISVPICAVLILYHWLTSLLTLTAPSDYCCYHKCTYLCSSDIAPLVDESSYTHGTI